jgi:hypothetical protein
MKVLDLHCRQGHVFEGWFASEEDFQDQLRQSMLQCPMCMDVQISKSVSAPRLNLGARQSGHAVPSVEKSTPAGESAVPTPELQAAWLALARTLVARTEDVGEQFAQEARRMHRGEAQERAIRGRTSPDEAVRLLEEGIDILPLPLPEAVKETLQ